MTEGWFHTQGLTNNGIYGKARQRDDANIVPYKLFAAFTKTGKVFHGMVKPHMVASGYKNKSRAHNVRP